MNLVTGAMKTLGMFTTRDGLNDDNLGDLVQNVFPPLLKILRSDSYPGNLRSLAANLFYEVGKTSESEFSLIPKADSS